MASLLHCSLHSIATGVLHCTKLHCTALHCNTLHCTALHFSALHCTALQFSALHCTALHCTALHCTALHCTALHCTKLLHCTVLYCISPYFSAAYKRNCFIFHDNCKTVHAWKCNDLEHFIDKEKRRAFCVQTTCQPHGFVPLDTFWGWWTFLVMNSFCFLQNVQNTIQLSRQHCLWWEIVLSNHYYFYSSRIWSIKKENKVCLN